MRLLLSVVLLACTSLAAAAEELAAEIGWLDETPLGTPLTGVIEEVRVTPGERVKAGTVLLRLDDRVFRARFEQARAELAQAEEDRAEAQRELERSQELYDRTLLSEHDLQLARIARKKAEAAYHAARTRWAKARYDLEYASVRAPFDAVVLELLVRPGETVVNAMQGRTLAVVARAGQWAARAGVDAAQAAALKQGMPVEVAVADGRYRGRLRWIGARPDTDGRFRIEVAFEAGEGLWPGLPARIILRR